MTGGRQPFGTLCTLAVALYLGAARGQDIDYERDIAPLLAEHCVSCHGAEKAESSLRLDQPAGVLAGGASGPAIVPGRSQESLLLKAVEHAEGVAAMPAEADKLSADVIERLRTWIDAGAPGASLDSAPSRSAAVAASHWAFQPLAPGEIPAVAHAAWVRTPLDAFVLSKLEAAGLAPSPEADRATLIRRLSLDLCGVPPEPGEVDRFLYDNRPDAYEQLVDRLLASPHYGERWARHWLDLARYADSNGYTIDGGRSIWKYRDWVIGALNNDLPFDQFTIEQLAGDLLPEPTLDQRVATGFHRNTLTNEEGGTDPEQFRVEAVADRVSTTGLVWLGLTVGCARCHDHKYDPISQREFYELFAFFNHCDEPSLSVPTDQQQRELPSLTAEIESVKKRLGDVEANAGTRQAEWEQKLAGRLEAAWRPLELTTAESAGGAVLERQDDQSWLVTGQIPAHDVYTLSGELPAEPLAAVRLEALTDERLPGGGPGLADNGNFILTGVSLAISRTVDGQPAEFPLEVAWARADHEQGKFPLSAALDDDSQSGWAINTKATGGSLNVPRQALLAVAQPPSLLPGDRLTVVLRHEAKQNRRYQIGRLRLSVTAAPAEVLSLPDDVRRMLARQAAERSETELKRIREVYLPLDPERIPVARALAELEERQQQLRSAITTTLVLAERKEPRPTTIHVRGDFLRPGAAVEPHTPRCLPEMTVPADRSPNRLDLARWLVSGQNPLPPRVLVNRVWQQYFGRGLVETENDFGTQGARPTHPELLDWLARELMADGWSLKALHRRITCSATYRQSSRHRPDLAAVDPLNHLLGRQNRLRLEAETIRDSALAASGLWTREIGGPGVYPPQPEGIYRFTQQKKYWEESQGPDRYRRTMYTYFWRSSPFPFLTTFDAPDANVTCTRRPRSDTPLQALALANDRGLVELARGVASRVLRECPVGDEARLKWAWRLCLVREPSRDEQRALEQLLADERARFAADSAAAEQSAPANRPADISPAEGAAWAAVTRVLCNLDEFVTRE